MSETGNSSDELRTYVSDVLHNHLDYYAGRLVHAASERYSHTIYTQTFTVAVGGIALHERTPMIVTARDAISPYGGFNIVAQQFPQIAYRSEHDWQDALGEAWTKVHFKPEATPPEDRSAFGYIELLEALRKHTATFGRSV